MHKGGRFLVYSQVIAANEGTALAMAAGHYLATGSVASRLSRLHVIIRGSAQDPFAEACVYLQNSGLGNTINPLLSLCSKKARQECLREGDPFSRAALGICHSRPAPHWLARRARPSASMARNSSLTQAVMTKGKKDEPQHLLQGVVPRAKAS